MSRILLFGDICPTSDYRYLFNSGTIFSEAIISDIKSSDFVVGNLECPATESNTPIKKAGPNLKAELDDIRMLSNLGFNAFSLANNHILDYGYSGVEDTIAALKLNGLKYFGAGENIAEAKKCLIINIGCNKVGFLSFAEQEFNLATNNTPGANHFDILDSFDIIKQTKEIVDYLIVLYHGGIEYYQYPSPLVQRKCRKMIDSGADFVSIQHSHCIGTTEKYHNGHIIYGQGNSVFGVRSDKSWNHGLLISIDVESRSVDYKLLTSTATGVCYEDDVTSETIITELAKRSEKVQDPEWIKKSWIDFCLMKKKISLPQLFGHGKWFNRLNRLLNNKLIDLLYSSSAKMVAMNLIRCEAHHEVMCSILENESYKK